MINYIPLFSYLLAHLFSAANLVKFFQNGIFECFKIPILPFSKKELCKLDIVFLSGRPT